jgi:predicted TIM-barrel fold metal-dependent hydrolase
MRRRSFVGVMAGASALPAAEPIVETHARWRHRLKGRFATATSGTQMSPSSGGRPESWEWRFQAHTQPYFAPQIEKLAAAHPDTRVILDHFGHAGTGQAERTATGWRVVPGETGYRDLQEFDLILRLAKLRQVFLKVSSLQYSSRQPHPHTDLRPLARKAFDAFGPDRMFWGSYGHAMKDLRQKEEVFAANFDFLNAGDRAKIRAGTAIRFFKFA